MAVMARLRLGEETVIASPWARKMVAQTWSAIGWPTLGLMVGAPHSG